jgi:hypothetical protein
VDGLAGRGTQAQGGAAPAEADRLRSRIEELSWDLARAEEQVSRLVIAREEVARVLEEPAAAEPPAGPAGKPAGGPRPTSPIGAVTVPPWQEGAEASVLPRSYEDLLEVAADAGRPLRAAEFAAAAGLVPTQLTPTRLTNSGSSPPPPIRRRVCGTGDKLSVHRGKGQIARIVVAAPRNAHVRTPPRRTRCVG